MMPRHCSLQTNRHSTPIGLIEVLAALESDSDESEDKRDDPDWEMPNNTDSPKKVPNVEAQKPISTMTATRFYSKYTRSIKSDQGRIGKQNMTEPDEDKTLVSNEQLIYITEANSNTKSEASIMSVPYYLPQTLLELESPMPTSVDNEHQLLEANTTIQLVDMASNEMPAGNSVIQHEFPEPSIIDQDVLEPNIIQQESSEPNEGHASSVPFQIHSDQHIPVETVGCDISEIRVYPVTPPLGRPAKNIVMRETNLIPVQSDGTANFYTKELESMDLGANVYIRTDITNGSSSDENDENRVKVMCRKRVPRPRKWKRNILKDRRNRGKSYINAKGKEVEGRVMLPAGCTLRKCKRKCQDVVAEEDRCIIFQHYWGLGSYQRQQEYLANHIKKVTCQQSKVKGGQREFSFEYYLTIGELQVRVCLDFFRRTLGETENKIRYHREKKMDKGSVTPDKRGKHGKQKKVSQKVKESIKDHINSYPAMESHYTRNRSKRKYLPSGLSIQMMFREYVKLCESKGIRPPKDATYRNIFCREFNLGFHHPKKDQCKLCTLYKNANEKHRVEMQEKYDAHQNNKMRAREHKANDKADAISDNRHVVATFDLQKVLNCPSGKVGELYYKRKLANYNLTVFDMAAKQGYCYIWNELVAKRGACEIASCIWLWLQNLDSNTVEKVTLYSDSCPGQNKNVIVAAMLLSAVRILDINEINQKFMEPGHTQMEVDSIHASIERVAEHTTIYVPHDWATVASLAKKSGKPYLVHELDSSKFKDWKSVAQVLIINRHISDEGDTIKWREMKWLRFHKTDPDVIGIKHSLNEEEQFLHLRVRKETKGRPLGDEKLKEKLAVNLYSSHLCVSMAKKKDLVSLCKAGIIPEMHHSFYENIVSTNNERDCLMEPNQSDESDED